MITLSPPAARAQVRPLERVRARHGWLIGMLALALLSGALPHVLAACCAPPRATGFGTAWFVNDFAQYEYAIREGAEQPSLFSGWLLHDPFTSEPNPAAFMFPLYTVVGKLSGAFHIPAMALEQMVDILARVVLVLALWRFCRMFARGKQAARWAFGLALFGSGFEVFGALVGGYSGNWSYELNGFGLLFAAPHVPLAMAATLELAGTTLRPMRELRLWVMLKCAFLSAVIALLHPFHAPVLLTAALIAGLLWWRSGRGVANVLGALVACVAALPVLVPTVTTFSLQPFWVSTYSTQNLLPSPAPHELLVDLGTTLLLVITGWFLLRGRVAAFGVVLWLLLALTAMYIPVPYQRRLSFGIDPILAVMAANTLVALCARLSQPSAALLKLGTLALAISSTLVILVSMVVSGFRNAPLPVYRSTTDLDAAAMWLDSNASATDLILADWDASNYLAARTPARVYGGHPVATMHADQKRFAIAAAFAHPSSDIVARGLGAQWLVYGPGEIALPGPAAAPVFQSGDVRVYRIS